MTNTTYIIAAVVALVIIGAIVAVFASRKSDDDVPEVILPPAPPAPQRADLKFGYYGSYGPQVSETILHSNLHWDAFWEGPQGAIDNMIAGQRATVLDVSVYLFEGDKGKRRLRMDGGAALRDLFTVLRGAGVLQLVKVLVPRDEPNLPKDNVCDLLPEAVARIRLICVEFPELALVKIGCIYAGGKPMPHVELFDIVGFDDYDAKEGVLKPGGAYDQLRAKLRPDQQTWLVPGGYAGQNPGPFVAFANAHPEVWGIVAFLWQAPPWETFNGIRDIPEMKTLYVAAGEQIVKASSV